MTDISDSELMLRFMEGNTHAFEMLFQRYRIPLFNFIYRMLDRDRTQAEDLLQEIFLKVAKAKHSYQPQARFSSWLFAIARNHCLNFLKSKPHRQALHEVSLDALLGGDGPSLADSIPADTEVFKELTDDELQTLIDKAISALPSPQKETFLLHTQEGFSHEETAEILNTNPATVRTHYHRARRLLRQKVGAILRREEEQP